MKSINKILMKENLRLTKNIKREEKSRFLIWTTKPQNVWQMPPFIGQNLELLIWWLIIEWVTNSWLGFKSLSSCLNKTSLITSEFEPPVLMKVLGNYLIFPGKTIEVIWTSKTWDMGSTLNSVWATRLCGYIYIYIYI